MEHLVNQLPELTLLIVEKILEGENDDGGNNLIINNNVHKYGSGGESIGVASALSFARSCKGVEMLVEYLFKKKCMEVINPSFRGWKDIEQDKANLRWTQLYLEASKVKTSLLLAWSFHAYTPDECEKVFDHSKNKCHGMRTFTELTDGQFGKAMRFPHPADGSLHQMRGSQVVGMMTPPPESPVDQFTLATWFYIDQCATSSIISLLLTPKMVPSQRTMMNLGQSFIVLNISETGNLFFGKNNVSTHSLQSGVWHHLVITGNAQSLRIYAWDATRARNDYAEILCVAQACVPPAIKMVVMVGNGKKGSYCVEELCLVGQLLEQERFWWLREGLPFV